MSHRFDYTQKISVTFQSAQEALDCGPGTRKGGWYFLEEATGRCTWYQQHTPTEILTAAHGNGLLATWSGIMRKAEIKLAA